MPGTRPTLTRSRLQRVGYMPIGWLAGRGPPERRVIAAHNSRFESRPYPDATNLVIVEVGKSLNAATARLKHCIDRARTTRASRLCFKMEFFDQTGISGLPFLKHHQRLAKEGEGELDNLTKPDTGYRFRR